MQSRKIKYLARRVGPTLMGAAVVALLCAVPAPSDAGKWQVVNPQTYVYLGKSDHSRRYVELKGKWIPGKGHPAWGPTGDSRGRGKWAALKRMNKWCAVLAFTREKEAPRSPRSMLIKLLYRSSSKDVTLRAYTGKRVEIPRDKPHVYIFMNDDKFGDNAQGKPPMRARFTGKAP